MRYLMFCRGCLASRHNYLISATAVCLLFLLLPGPARAQRQMEFSSASATAITGPSNAPVVGTFLRDNGAGTFASFTPTITVTASWSNQQYTAVSGYTPGTGLLFGASASTGSSPVAQPVFGLMNSISSPLNTMFTSDPYAGTTGTGIDITQNYTFNCYTAVRPLSGQPTSGRYYMGTLTLAFNRAVSNPVLHVVGLGGTQGTVVLGFSTELELITPGVSLFRESGSTALNVTTAATATTPAGNWKILNNAVHPNANSQQSAATGSIRVTGNNITTLSFDVYIRGDGGNANWELSNTAGDYWLIGLSMNEPSIVGNVFHDANGLTDGNVNGTGTNVGKQMYVNLVNAAGTAAANGTVGNVYSSTAVADDGYYIFQDILPAYTASFDAQLSTVQGIAGTVAPAPVLPAGWVNTGSVLGTTGGSNTIPGVLQGIVLSTPAATVTNANFGIEQTPTANTLSSVSQMNPGGANRIQVPTLRGSDPEDGTYTGVSNTNTVKITSLPANGTLYYNNVAVTLNQVITNYNPSLLTVDPDEGAITVSFNYQELDAAGIPSADAAVTMPFTAVSVSGNVFHDANGMSDNMVAQSGSLTAIPSGLFANLVDVGTGNVVAAVSVNNSTGAYTFTDVSSGNYNIVLSTTQGSIGAPSPLATLPPGWAGTGENLGTGTGRDAIVDGMLSTVTVINTDVTNANFGIENTDVATGASYTISNPARHQVIALTAANAMGALAGTDPEDGTQGSGNTVKITSLSGMNGNVLLYNGSPVAANGIITNYDPSLLSVRFDGLGVTTASFDFVFADAGGIYGTTAAYTLSWATALPIRLLSFDAVADHQVVNISWTTSNETDIASYVVLHSTDGIQWEKIAEVQAKAGGNYIAADQHPVDGINYYRLQIKEHAGNYTYGPVRQVQLRTDAQITVSVYPNPVTSLVTVKMNSTDGHANMEILDAAGRLAGKTIMNGMTDIDMANYAPGLYTIRITDANNHMAEARVLKQ